MVVDPRDIQELVRLAWQVSRPEMRILEVGTATGGSARWFLAVAAENDGRLDCVDLWPDDDKWRKFKLGVLESREGWRIRVYRGDSSELLRQLEPSSYDLVFIDADHSYSFVTRDILNSLPLIRPGGILCGHDYDAAKGTAQQPGLVELSEMDTAMAIGEGRVRFRVHAGVMRAVDELLPMAAVSATIWHVRVNANDSASDH